MGQMKKTDMKAQKTEELQHKLEEEQERVRLALDRVEKRVAGAPDAPLNVLKLRVDTLWDLVKSIDLSRQQDIARIQQVIEDVNSNKI